jgi:hypothetical protein
MPYPTPIFDAEGDLLVAVNSLIDVAETRRAELLRSQASKCSRLAMTVGDQQTAVTLALMAAEYEQKASDI